MAPKTITIIGSLNTDLVTTTSRVPSGGETLTGTSFSTGPGGKGANQAVACSRLSRPNPSLQSTTTPDVVVKMIGAVGADEFGPMLLSSLQASKVDTVSISTISSTTTGVAVIIVEEASGENRILLNPGANYSLRPEDFLTAANLGIPLPDLVILQLEIPLDTVLQILKTARQAGVSVLLNPAPAVRLEDEVFKAVTHLIVNETEAALLTDRKVEDVEAEGFEWGVVADEFLGKGVGNVIVTLGGKGAYFASREGRGMVPAAKVKKVADTTAAGDTFVGAYAVSMVRKGGSALVTEEDVKAACKASGYTVQKQGAQTSIPWADEIDKTP
jgi:ribokinase